ncbi:MAG: Rv1355c family protein [Bacteroidota bacterium]
MKNHIADIQSRNESLNFIHSPVFFRISNSDDKNALENLLENGKVLFVYNKIEEQLRELIKCRNVGIRLNEVEYKSLTEKHLNGSSFDEYGVWVFYPWSGRLIHMLDEGEFIEVRTNRNQYKITLKERDILATKKIGIIGLSVGQSVALTLAMERGCGELVLADFDYLELSNLNRIRSGIQNLGINKVVLAAREIAEIDPFLKVTCYTEGIKEDNINSFFTLDRKLDLLVEECDGLDMKIIARLKARELGIPVLMDTSDRGMLDVERFDLNLNRPILHGLIENINLNDIREISDEDKVPIILQLLGLENISIRGKVSMIEVNQSINTWPQLASSVTLGGALVTDISRRILLNQFSDSGRYYIDFEELVKNTNDKESKEVLTRKVPFSPMTLDEMEMLANQYVSPKSKSIFLDNHTISSLVNAACAAPSTGNDQPWKWLYKDSTLFLFHDEYRSSSFGDFQKIASFITLGSAYENLYIHAKSKFGIEPEYDFFPISSNQRLVAAINFKASEENCDQLLDIKKLDAAILKRHTNRNSSIKVNIEQSQLDKLKYYAESIDGAKLQWITDEKDFTKLGKIIGACDRMRIFNDEGHIDFAQREMRWTEEEAEESRDGIFIKTLGLNESQLAALKVIKNHDVIKGLRELGGGKAFEVLANRSLVNASAMCYITLPEYSLKSFFEGGRSMERFWLLATDLGFAIHPLISPLYLFPRVLHANAEGISDKDAEELIELRKEFKKIFDAKDDVAEVFITKIAVAEEPILKTLRLPIEEVLFFN